LSVSQGRRAGCFPLAAAMIAQGIPANIQPFPRLGDWIEFVESGLFQLRTGKVEIGQGIANALTRIACDALGIDPDQALMVAGDTSLCPDEGYTSGSQSIEMGGAALRHAGQVAQQRFAALAAKHFAVDPGHLSIARGVFHCDLDGRSISYHALAQGVDYPNWRIDCVEPNPSPLAKTRFGPAEPGQAIKGPGAPLIPGPAAGGVGAVAADLGPSRVVAQFIHDIKIDGMLHARVLRGLHPHAKVVQVDRGAIESLPGVQTFVWLGDFLALVGSNEALIAQAQSLAQAYVVWSAPLTIPGADTEAWLLSLPAQTQWVAGLGPSDATIAATRGAAQRLVGRYSRPYIAHGAIGPSCALAAPTEAGGLTIWTHSQGVFQLRDEIGRALQRTPASLRVIHQVGSGCYGHNGADDVAFDAALLAHTLNVPVRVQWSRQQELAQSPMGAASLIQIDAGLDASGRICDWRQAVWSQSHNNRPGSGGGIHLLGARAFDPSLPEPVAKDVPLPTGGGLRNAIPYYELPALTVEHHFLTEAPVRTSALRSLGGHANGLAIESFMDELAQLAGQDPLAFRLGHLHDARARAVLESVAAQCGWSALREQYAVGEGQGIGIGFARYKNRAGFAAVAIEVQVAHQVSVPRVWVAADVGLVIDRDGVLNQIEGGVIQALSWCLKEAVRWDADGVQTADWETYPILGFDELPTMDIVLLEPEEALSLGAGEIAAGPVAGALANALTHALGVRPRHLPFTVQRLRELIENPA